LEPVQQQVERSRITATALPQWQLRIEDPVLQCFVNVAFVKPTPASECVTSARTSLDSLHCRTRRSEVALGIAPPERIQARRSGRACSSENL